MRERRAVVQQTFRRYQKADRKHKGRILEEFVQLTSLVTAERMRRWCCASGALFSGR
jgi:hypothetical protein